MAQTNSKLMKKGKNNGRKEVENVYKSCAVRNYIFFTP